MKTEITSKDYKDIYEACNWNPSPFEKVLKKMGYDFGNLTIHEEFITLPDEKKIKEFVGVKEVYGDIHLNHNPLISLGNLEYVQGSLDVENTPLRSLGNLKEVTGNIFATDSKLEDIGNLKRAYDEFFIVNTPLCRKDQNISHLLSKKLRTYVHC